jgi:hypothetical protein
MHYGAGAQTQTNKLRNVSAAAQRQTGPTQGSQQQQQQQQQLLLFSTWCPLSQPVSKRMRPAAAVCFMLLLLV